MLAPIEMQQPPPPLQVPASASCDSWLSLVPDQVHVADLALPATHNSGTADSRSFHLGWSWARCQRASIGEQLSMGVRAFDLRLSDCFDSGEIVVSHTLCSSVTLKQVAEVVARFLSNHPSEFVLLTIQRDWEHRNKWSEDSDMVVCETLHAGLPLAFYSGEQPTVGELRGQCAVFLQSMPLVAEAAGGWPEHLFTKNDCWNLGSINAAKQAISLHLGGCLDDCAADPDKALRWLGCNVVVGVRPPNWVAGKVNDHLCEVLQQVYRDGGSRSRSLGVIAVDFADAATVFSIVVCNFWVQFPAPQQRVASFRSLCGEAGRSELHSGSAGVVVVAGANVSRDESVSNCAAGEYDLDDADERDSWTIV